MPGTGNNAGILNTGERYINHYIYVKMRIQVTNGWGHWTCKFGIVRSVWVQFWWTLANHDSSPSSTNRGKVTK